LQKKTTQKTKPGTSGRFRPGATGACEAQVWTFVGPQRILDADENTPEMHWVAAESLDAALRYMRRRFEDFTITEARLVGIIPLVSGSPLD
jgi:hypothetical protein